MNTIKTILKTAITIIAIIITTVFYTSCRKKTTTPPNPNEEELITTLRIDFIDSAGVQPSATVIFKDADGDGGNNPTQWDSIKLKANTTYFASILLLDETKSPVDTISNEVLEEGKDHLFCFTGTNVNTSIIRTDLDVNNIGIGLQSAWRNTAVSNGTMQVVLRHQPDVKTGACEPGSTDVDVTFQFIIQ
jgi:hypothetical protein